MDGPTGEILCNLWPRSEFSLRIGVDSKRGSEIFSTFGEGAGGILKRTESGSDNSLMLQVRAGRIDTLGLLFERHKNALFGYFYRITGSAEISEDLVQNVFLRILKYRAQFAGEGKFTTWMYHIAHNVSADHFQKCGVRPDAVDPPGAAMEDCQTPEERMLERERLRLIEDALFQLSADQREILVLSRFQGLKYREIGAILGCSVGAVKVRVFRAIMSLKQVYAELEG